MIIRCTSCGNEREIIEHKLVDISCQKCGNFEVEFICENTNIVAKCGLCKDFIIINTKIPFIGYHTKPRCKSSKFILLPEVRPEDIPKISEVSISKLIYKKRTSNASVFDTTKVSVVIVCHNNISTTKKCIEHLRKSTVPVEIILVDNNSTDSTSIWAKKQDDILYIKNNCNFGCGIARNQGAIWAANDHILFLDNDQFVSPGSIAKLLEVKCDLVGVETWNVYSNGNTRRTSGIGNTTYVGAGGLLVKKEVFHSLGGFDERFSPAWYEDVDFSMRARLHGYTIGYVEDHGVKHIGNATIRKQKDFDPIEIKKKSKNLFKGIWNEYLFKGRISPKNPKPNLYGKRGFPSVLMIIDVPGWAWDIKAKQIIKYLSDEFDFTLYYGQSITQSVISKEFDIYFTFECGQLNNIRGIPYDRLITGVTAHTYVRLRNYKEHLKNCKFIHANSVLLYNEIKEFNKHCYYLPNGVNESLFSYVERDITKPFTVGYVGKELRAKGLRDYIIPACNEAGVKLKKQVCKYNSDNKIEHGDMPKWYEDIDVVLIASDMDGTPNQLLEAASVGRTFIGNRIGNVPEFVKEGVNGFMVDKEIKCYVEKLIELKKDREKCKRMGIEARKTVLKDWTWKTQAENYRMMFKDFLGHGG